MLAHMQPLTKAWATLALYKSIEFLVILPVMIYLVCSVACVQCPHLLITRASPIPTAGEDFGYGDAGEDLYECLGQDAEDPPPSSLPPPPAIGNPPPSFPPPTLSQPPLPSSPIPYNQPPPPPLPPGGHRQPPVVPPPDGM